MNHKPYLQFRLLKPVLLFSLCILIAAAALAQVLKPHISFEAESGTRTGQAAVVSDTVASNGQALQFSATGGPSGKKCVVTLHGKGGAGGATWQNGDITMISPTGNGDGGGWGPAHWEYATPTTFNQAYGIINNSITPENCGQVSLIGFSNGASMAAKVFCQGQTFNNRLVGVIVDDPVPDQGVDNCAPGSGVAVRLIFSNDMGWITDGTACPGGWTCQGTLYGRATYQSKLGAPSPLIKQSHTPSNDVYPSYYNPWWR